VRIIRLCRDEIDGIPLRSFEVGLVYDVSASVGSYLIAIGCAEAVLEEEYEVRQEEERQFRVNVRRWRTMAADVSARSKRPKSS
jgi:hypothetical protein